MEEVEDKIKYVPEVGDIVRIVKKYHHLAVVGSLAEVTKIDEELAVVKCVTNTSLPSTGMTSIQYIVFDCLEKVGEVIAPEPKLPEATKFNVLDKVWVEGTIRSRLDDGGKYGVTVEDYGVYGDSTIISAKPSQLKRR